MPKFEEFLEAFISGYDPNTFKPDEFKSAALGAYNEERGLWDAKIETLSQGSQQTADEIRALKAANWDLLMSKGTPVDKGGMTPVPEGESDEGDDGDLPTVADLFKKE